MQQMYRKLLEMMPSALNANSILSIPKCNWCTKRNDCTSQPVAGVASRQHLRSAAQRLLVVPRHQLSSYGRRAFCVAGPSVWNSLPDNLRNPIIGGNSFRQSLKTFLFATYWCIRRIRGFTSMRYINRLFTYLLTYQSYPKWLRTIIVCPYSILCIFTCAFERIHY